MAVNLIEQYEETEDTQYGRYLTFALDKEVFALEIRYVTEIIGMQPISTIPEVPAYMKGIINLRGKIIPVIDMRMRFKKKSVEYSERTCIVVIDTGEENVGLIVDQVDEVVSIDDENIEPPPEKRAGFKNRFLRGIGKIDNDVKLILDCKKLFSENI